MGSFEAGGTCLPPPQLFWTNLFCPKHIAERLASLLEVCLPWPIFILLFPQVFSQLFFPPHPSLRPWANCFTSLRFIFLICKMRIATPAFCRLFWESNVVVYVEGVGKALLCVASIIYIENLLHCFLGMWEGVRRGGRLPREVVDQNPRGFFKRHTYEYLPYTCMCIHAYIHIYIYTRNS